MISIKEAAVLHDYLQFKKRKGYRIGFVPTMGALHAGHESLIRAAQPGNDLVVCSIFVNPTQFNVRADYEKYPITLDQDLIKLHSLNVDILFLPSVETLYPGGTDMLETYDLGYLETILEGKYRPGHFQGVCQVMNRLLKVVAPHNLYMGQKDYQQCMVIQKLLHLLSMEVKLVTCPTLREADGLAMSSRNLRLDPVQRKKAAGIYEVLIQMRQQIRPGSTQALKQVAIEMLNQHEFRVDYVETASAVDLSLQHQWNGNDPMVALVAAFQGEVRLIDNMQLT